MRNANKQKLCFGRLIPASILPALRTEFTALINFLSCFVYCCVFILITFSTLRIINQINLAENFRCLIKSEVSSESIRLFLRPWMNRSDAWAENIFGFLSSISRQFLSPQMSDPPRCKLKISEIWMPIPSPPEMATAVSRIGNCVSWSVVLDRVSKPREFLTRSRTFLTYIVTLVCLRA